MADETGDLTAQAEETLAETPARPDWLNEKYTSVEDQAKAYAESEQRMQRATEDASRERRERERIEQERDELYELQQQSSTQQFQDPNQNPYVLEMMRAREDGDVAREVAIFAQLQDTIVAQRLEAQTKQAGSDQRGLDPYLIGQMREQIATKHGADEALQAKAFEIMESNPMFASRLDQIANDPHATIGDLAPVVETAYELAKGGIVQNQQQQTLAQQQLEQERAKERKLGQESLSGTGGRVASQDEQAQAWERIQAAKSTGIRIS